MTEPLSDERLAEIRAGDFVRSLITAAEYDCYDKFEDRFFYPPEKHPASEAARIILGLLSRLDKAEESVEIMTALTRTPLYSHRALTERLSQIMGARFGARFMDPPDGGDVPIHEQVERMADALLAAERPSES